MDEQIAEFEASVGGPELGRLGPQLDPSPLVPDQSEVVVVASIAEEPQSRLDLSCAPPSGQREQHGVVAVVSERRPAERAVVADAAPLAGPVAPVADAPH